jgi:hypothetical protein
MNFGDCPYCNDFLGAFEVPDRTPAYAQVNCQSCGKKVWYRFSRINPMAWTIEDFEREYEVSYAKNGGGVISERLRHFKQGDIVSRIGTDEQEILRVH